MDGCEKYCMEDRKGRDHVENLGISRKTILKWILNKL